MPCIYLSPSLQAHHVYAGGIGNEERYMNEIADAMVPYLRAYQIDFVRNDPQDTLRDIIRRSNASAAGLHLCLHSNTAPSGLSGMLRGPDFYYYAHSACGRRAAEIFSLRIGALYPNSNLTASIPNETLPELQKTRAPALLAELAYHDNYTDAQWIAAHIPDIAKALADGAAEYLGLPILS